MFSTIDRTVRAVLALLLSLFGLSLAYVGGWVIDLAAWIGDIHDEVEGPHEA